MTDPNEIAKLVKKSSSSLDDIDERLSDIYKQTYNTSKEGDNLFAAVTDKLDNELSKFAHLDNDLSQMQNITSVYSTLVGKTMSKGTTLDKFFEDAAAQDGLSSNEFLNTKDIVMRDAEYESVCKYMPKTKTALELKRDNVLSADNFKKEFISVKNSTNLNENDNVLFSANMEALIKTYKLESYCEEIVDDAYQYGEYFLYNVPYKKAFQRLLSRKQNGGGYVNNHLHETAILENGNFTGGFKVEGKIDSNPFGEASGLTIVLHKSGVFDSVIEEHTNMIKMLDSINESYGSIYEAQQMDLREAAIQEAAKKKKDTTIKRPVEKNQEKFKMNQVFDGSELEFDGIQDGLLTPTSNNDADAEKVKNIPGFILKKLQRRNIIPIYLEDTCLGYYYMELDPMKDTTFTTMGGMTTSGYRSNNSSAKIGGTDYKNQMIEYLTTQISNHINSNFINTNQNMKKEIYTILKYADSCNIMKSAGKLNVSFLPAEDVEHFYFKMDKETHRGISSLESGLILMKMWISITQSNTMGIMTRSQDHRVYYVKQQVDTNVYASLMNTVNQLQKGNMGIRQMESINNILGLIGRFNDYMVPVGQNGESPINFEVMQGQDIKTQDDFLATLEDQAISSTDVPLELVNAAKSMDYAIHYTMSSSKFLKVVYRDQAILERMLSRLVTKIYNSEYETNYDLEFTLPAPSFLAMTNGANLLDNAKQYVASIVEIELADEDDIVKQSVTRKLIKHLIPNYIDAHVFDKIKKEAKAEIASITIASNDQEQEPA